MKIERIDGVLYWNEQRVKWAGVAQRYHANEPFSAKIDGWDQSRNDEGTPQIGDLINVLGGRSGAEFIAPIMAIRAAPKGTRYIFVMAGPPPWATETHLARQMRAQTEALQEARRIEILQQLDLCVVCEEGPLEACACVQRKKRKQDQLEKEAAERAEVIAWAAHCDKHNAAADQRRRALTADAVRKALAAADGRPGDAGRALGVDKFNLRVTRNWTKPEHLEDLTVYSEVTYSPGSWLSGWMSRKAPELQEYASQLRDQAEVAR